MLPRILASGLICVALTGPALAAEDAASLDAGALQSPPGETVAPAAEPSATPPQASTEPAPAPLTVLPGRQGYAFEKPEILARQRIFGLAHGVSLLAAACLDLPAQASAIEEAYAAWHAKQATAIETVVKDLARYYFGPRAEEAQWPDLVKALGLREDIGAALGEFSLEVACLTLPQVLDKPRYDLSALLADPGRFDAPPAATAPIPPAAAPAPVPEAPAPAPTTPPPSGTQGPPGEPLPATGTPAPTFPQPDFPPAHD